MRRSGRLLIIVGVMMGLAAAVLAVVALTGGDEEDGGDQATTPQDVTIIQAKRDVEAHTVLTADDLEEVVVKEDAVPNVDDVARDVGEVVGFAYSENLVEGQRILRSRLEVSGIAEELELGKRAISLSVDKDNFVAGLIRQDDSVDLVYEVNAEVLGVLPTSPIEISRGEASLETDIVLPPFGEQPNPRPYPFAGDPGSRFIITDRNAGNPIAKVVLQDIRVLRVITGSQLSGEASQSNDLDHLVLEVTPNQAELIHLMRTVGSFQVMLRGVNDDEIVNTAGVNMELLVTQWNLPVPKTIRLPEAGAQ